MERTLSASPQSMLPATLADINVTEQDQDIELGPITVMEVKDAINKLKNGRAPGNNNVYAGMLKEEEQELTKCLQHILHDVLDNEVIPDA